MATGPGLAMKMTADTAGLTRGVNKTEQQLSGLARSTKQAASAMRTLVGIKVGELLARGLRSAASAIGRFVSEISTSVDETAKLAARTGIAVEALQGFQVAAGLSGVQNLEGAVQRLTITIGDAGQGVKTAEEGLSRLGLSFDELSAMAPEDQFRAVSAAISELPSQAEKAAAAADLFGRTGVELLPLFESNLAAIEERAQRLGIVLSSDQTAAIEEMNDALSLVYQTFQGIIGQVTANLAPAITAIAEEFLQFVEGYEGLGEGTGGTALADSITQALFDGAEYLAGVLDSMLLRFESFVAGIETIATVFEYVAKTFYVVAEVIRGIFNAEQVIGSMLFVGIGKLIEYLGSWVSDDLEKAGREFAESSKKAMKKNAIEAGGAFANASGVIFGGDGGESSDGVFSEAVQKARERFAERSSPEAKAAREAKRAQQQADREYAAKLKKLVADLERAEKQRTDAVNKRDEEIAKKREDIAKAEAEYAARNAEELAKVNTQALKVSDIRSGGIDQVLALATGREDPAIVEARKQVAELKAMREKLDALAMMPIEIAGAA